MSGPQDWITTAGLMGATIAAGLGCAASVRRVMRGEGASGRLDRVAALVATLLCGAVFIYRLATTEHGWSPLTSHVDGLALLGALLGAMVVYLQWTRQLGGVGMFALGALAVSNLWGVCASWWTLRVFDIAGVWGALHLMSVYGGTIGVMAAAAAGALWLYVDREMRRRDHMAERLRRLGRLGDLESIERMITISATVGFVLLTIGLATGVVIVSQGPNKLGAGWWHSPKVLLAAAAWAIYAIVMNVHLVSQFRGRRAAALSIVGLVLLFGVLALSQAMPGGEPTDGATPRGVGGGD